MKRTSIHINLFVFLSVFFLTALAFIQTAEADLVYEQEVLLEKLDLVRIDSTRKGGTDGKEAEAKKKKKQFVFSQRYLISGNKMKITNTGGSIFYIDLDADTITRLSKDRGVFTTLSFDKYLAYRAETETLVQAKRKAQAEYLLTDIMNSIEAIKDKRERERRLKNPPKIVEYLQKIIAGTFEYEEYHPETNPRRSRGVFRALKFVGIMENEREYIKKLFTKEIPFNNNPFLCKLALFPAGAAKLFEDEENFTAEIDGPYDFKDQTVRAYSRVTSFCEADLPEELFEIPSGYKEQNERFETIYETPKF